MRSATWQLALATGLGIVAATVISHGTRSSAQTAPAGRAQAAQPAASAQVTKAIAVVHPLGDSKVSGKVVFTQTRSGVEISAEIKGLAGIPLDFQLYLLHGSQLEAVSNEQIVKLHENERFRAVSGQDVS